MAKKTDIKIWDKHGNPILDGNSCEDEQGACYVRDEEARVLYVDWLNRCAEVDRLNELLIASGCEFDGMATKPLFEGYWMDENPELPAPQIFDMHGNEIPGDNTEKDHFDEIRVIDSRCLVRHLDYMRLAILLHKLIEKTKTIVHCYHEYKSEMWSFAEDLDELIEKGGFDFGADPTGIKGRKPL